MATRKPKIPPALCRSALTEMMELEAQIERLKSDHKFEYDACQVVREENKKLTELLTSSVEAIQQLEKAVKNLLPGARRIVADIGLINTALCYASDVRREIFKILDG